MYHILHCLPPTGNARYCFAKIEFIYGDIRWDSLFTTENINKTIPEPLVLETMFSAPPCQTVPKVGV